MTNQNKEPEKPTTKKPAREYVIGSDITEKKKDFDITKMQGKPPKEKKE